MIVISAFSLTYTVCGGESELQIWEMRLPGSSRAEHSKQPKRLQILT